MRLRAQALLLFAPLAAVSALAMAGFSRRAAFDLMENQVRQRAEALAASLARLPETSRGLRLGDEDILLPVLQTTLRGGAAYAGALDASDVVVAHTNVALAGRPYASAPPRRGRVLEVSAPVLAAPTSSEELFMLSGKDASQPQIGRIVLAMPLDEASATADMLGRRVMAVIALVGAATLALAWILLRRVLTPAATLAEAAARIAAGRLGESVPVPATDELAELARSFNRMSEALARTTVSKEFFDRILSAMRDGVVVYDRDGMIQLVNEAAAHALGGVGVGKPIDALFASGGEAFRPEALAGLRPGAALEGQEALLNGRDDKIPVLCSAARLSAAEGGRSGFVLTFRDISNRKQAEEALAQYADDLSRSNAELEQFAYVASHDLQEPLRKVASYCQLLQRRYQGKLDADADQFIAYAVDGAARMKRLIEDLLGYSRLTRKEIVLSPIELRAPVERALENLELAVKDAGAEVVIGELPRVLGDVPLLTQVFQNLIGNALKFKAATKPRVEVSAERKDGLWTVTVADNGIGIDPKYFDRLFQIFQRLHTRREYTGSGIGLSICRKIVERHGGRIWVESEVGRGARFRFTLRAEGEEAA